MIYDDMVKLTGIDPSAPKLTILPVNYPPLSAEQQSALRRAENVVTGLKMVQNSKNMERINGTTKTSR